MIPGFWPAVEEEEMGLRFDGDKDALDLRLNETAIMESEGGQLGASFWMSTTIVL